MKVAICTPVYADVKAEFLVSLVNMVAASGNIVVNGARLEIRTFVSRGLLPMTRNIAAKEALDWEADFVLWADSDMVFTSDALARLLRHDVEIVGVNYPRRDSGLPSASVTTTKENAEAGTVEPVESLGLGLVLMRAATLRRLRDEARKERLPLFHFELRDNGYLGEDLFFFARCRRLGIPIHLDHALSWDVAHVADRLLTNRTDADRARWSIDDSGPVEARAR